MVCGGCMAAQARRQAEENTEYVWTDGTIEVVYSTLIQAKAKVLRSGGVYTPRAKG